MENLFDSFKDWIFFSSTEKLVHFLEVYISNYLSLYAAICEFYMSVLSVKNLKSLIYKYFKCDVQYLYDIVFF